MGTRQEQLDQIEREKQILTNQDLIMSHLKDIEREQILLREGHEKGTWGEAVLEMEDVEPEDIPIKEIEDA